MVIGSATLLVFTIIKFILMWPFDYFKKKREKEEQKRRREEENARLQKVEQERIA